jgi:hypothetical protein
MDLAVIQDWIEIRRERITAPDHLDAINALAMCLDGSESPSAVAVIITKAYSSYVGQPLKNSDNDRVQSFWVMLCDAARMFGSAQSRLVELLYEMSSQPDIYATDGSLAKTTSGMVYWRDLPGFPFALCDDALCTFVPYRRGVSANGIIPDYHHPYDHSPDKIDEFLEQAPYLLNGTRFAATLFEQGFHLPSLNLAVQADHFLEDGIESSHNDEHVVKSQAWKVLLPVSVTWIMIAGKTIYKMCLDDHKVSLDLHSKRVWDKPRWEHWKEQLRLFENKHDFDEECRGYATRALAKMSEVEVEFEV